METIAFARKVIGIFDSRERNKVVALLVMMLVGAGFEVLGIGIIVPFIGILSNPGLIHENRLLGELYDILGTSSTQQFMLILGSCLLGIYVIKNAYLGFLAYVQSRFVFKKQAALSRRLLDAYMRSPYNFHLQRNTADLLKNLTTEVSGIIYGIMLPSLSLVSEGIVLIFIFTLLIIVEPFVALVTLVGIGAVSFLIYTLMKPVLSKYGRERAKQSGMMIKWVNQALGSIKETKILGRENFFIEAYHESSMEYAKAARVFSTLNIMPRLLIETLAVGSMLLVVVIMLARGSELQNTLPVLALFALAAARLMPSATRIFSSLNALRYYSPAINAVHKDLQHPYPAREAQGANANALATGALKSLFKSELELRGVWFRYSGHDTWSVQNVSLKISRGTSVALVGPTGAGKSTLVDLILGLLKPERGSILVDGLDIFSALAAWQRTIGYVPQSIYLLDDTIRRNVAFGMADEEIDDARVWDVLRAAQLEAKVKALPNGLDSYVGERGVRLSGGERQRIGIARALYHDPEILVFDEATSALDHQTEREISETMGHLRARKTLITIAHRLTTVKNSDQMFFMKEGAVVDSGSYEDLINKNGDFRMMIGKEIT